MLDSCWKSIDFALINLSCLHRLPSLLAAWLPDGQRQGREWVALNRMRRLGPIGVSLAVGCSAHSADVFAFVNAQNE
ncbi:hypothetical protein SAMN06295998_1409, partial [Primorskyibacter flagellatus]